MLAATSLDVTLAAVVARSLSRARHWLGGLLLVGTGFILLVPLLAQIPNDGTYFQQGLVLACYLVSCVYAGRWWPVGEGDILRWVLPLGAVVGSLASVLLLPLPPSEVVYHGQTHRTYLVERANGETLLYNTMTHRFATYPAGDLSGITPCFGASPLLAPGWPGLPAPRPVCQPHRLP